MGDLLYVILVFIFQEALVLGADINLKKNPLTWALLTACFIAAYFCGKNS